MMFTLEDTLRFIIDAEHGLFFRLSNRGGSPPRVWMLLRRLDGMFYV